MKTGCPAKESRRIRQIECASDVEMERALISLALTRLPRETESLRSNTFTRRDKRIVHQGEKSIARTGRSGFRERRLVQ